MPPEEKSELEQQNNSQTTEQEGLGENAAEKNNAENSQETENSGEVDEEEYLHGEFLKSLGQAKKEEDSKKPDEGTDKNPETDTEEELEDDNIYKDDPYFEKAINKKFKPFLSKLEQLQQENENLKAKISNVDPIVAEKKQRAIEAGVNKAKEIIKSRGLDPDKEYAKTIEFLNKDERLLKAFDALPLPLEDTLLMAHQYMTNKKVEFLTPEKVSKLKEQGVKENLAFKKSNISREAGKSISVSHTMTKEEFYNLPDKEYRSLMASGKKITIKD